jgi:hypothetical protein
VVNLIASSTTRPPRLLARPAVLTLPPVALALWPQIPRDAAPAFQGAPDGSH